MIWAMVSAEDKDFWINDGFDLSAIIRSAYNLLYQRWTTGSSEYGPGWSTLTQQIVKNTIVGRKKTINRKITEIIHARLLTYNSYQQNKQFAPYEDSTQLRKKTKQDIITYYLNRTFFGNNAHGIYEAAHQYFWVEPHDLTIAQSATLAAIPRSPYRFDLYKNPNNLLWYRSLSLYDKEIIINQQHPKFADIARIILSGNILQEKDLLQQQQEEYWRRSMFKSYLNNETEVSQTIDELFPIRNGYGTAGGWTLSYVPGRKDYVIQRLYEDKKITFMQAADAILSPIPLQDKSTSLTVMEAPHFVQYIKDSLVQNDSLGINEQQLYEWWYQITTTLDLSINNRLDQLNKQYSGQALSFWAKNRSILVTNMKDGAILWYIGSLDTTKSDIQGQVDMVRAKRQIGSTIKPLIYAYGLMNYPIGLDTIIVDKKKDFGGGFNPSNADNQSKWSMRLKNALAWSRNIPAVKMTDAIGGEKTVKPFLQSIGMKSLSQQKTYGLPLGLGVGEISMLELAQSYMEFADTENVGIVHGIQTIRTQLGDIIFDHEAYSYKRTIPLWVARLISYILSTAEFAPWYFRAMITVPKCRNCASKTGTTNMKVNGKNAARDAWIVTFSPKALITIRAGNSDASAMKKEAYGFTINTDIRNDIIKLLQEQWYMSESDARQFPATETKKHSWQGEGYSQPNKSTLPNSVVRKLQ